MFDNIGRKIKNFAVGVFVIEIIAGFITGLAIGISTDWDAAFLAILVIIASPLVAWVSAFLLYGFGQLIENSDKLVENTNKLVRANNQPIYRGQTQPSTQTSSNATNAPTPSVIHKWRCDKCGNMISENPCPYCNRNFTE